MRIPKNTFIILLLTFACIWFSAYFSSRVSAKSHCWIKVKPKVTGRYTVDVKIETNIPGSILLSASLALKGQRPNDTFIGTQFIRVPVQNGKGTATIDGYKFAMPFGSKLPASDYDVQVSFYPNWRENRQTATAEGINNAIKGKASVTLSASGASSSSVKSQAEGRNWVMQNVLPNHPWNFKFWREKFGPWQEVEYRGSGNPKILKMFYFKSIDMTLLVNDLKREIVTYRMGLAHK